MNFEMNKTLLLFLAVALASLVMMLSIIEVNAGERALLWVNPAMSSLEVGESEKKIVQLDDVEDVYALEIQLGFDSSVLNVLDADAFQTGTQIEAGSCPQPGFVVVNEVNNVSGIIDYAITQINPQNPCNGGDVAKIEFQCVGNGVSEVSFISSTISDRDGIQIEYNIISGKIECGSISPTPTPLPVDYFIYLPMILKSTQ